MPPAHRINMSDCFDTYYFITCNLNTFSKIHDKFWYYQNYPSKKISAPFPDPGASSVILTKWKSVAFSGFCRNKNYPSFVHNDKKTSGSGFRRGLRWRGTDWQLTDRRITMSINIGYAETKRHFEEKGTFSLDLNIEVWDKL